MIILKLLNKIALELINTAHEANDQTTILALGLTLDEARAISELTHKERNYIIDKGINLINAQVDIPTLKEAIYRCKEQSSYEQITHDAILLGATRDIMHQFAKMSGKQFSSLRQQLCIDKAKSYRLDDDQIQFLNLKIKALVLDLQIERPKITLPILVRLSKETELNIGSIHAHLVTVWGEKYDL